MQQHDEEEADERIQQETNARFEQLIGSFILSDPQIEKELDRAGKINSPSKRYVASNRVAQEAIRKFNKLMEDAANDTKPDTSNAEDKEPQQSSKNPFQTTPYFAAVRDAIPAYRKDGGRTTTIKKTYDDPDYEQSSILGIPSASEMFGFLTHNADTIAKIGEVAYKLGKFCFKLLKD